MKRTFALALATLAIISSLTGCNKQEASKEAENGPWTPSNTVNVVCCSSAGGGSDINSRAVIETFDKIGVDANFIVDYQTEGGGAVGWKKTADATDDHTLMCYGFGDTINMVTNSDYGMDDYRGVAMVSAEQLALLSTPDCAYEDFAAAVEAAKNGTVLTIVGSGGVDIIIYNKLLETTGLTESQMTYVQHNSTGEAIVTMLGNHCDYVICKPSSCISYVESGDLVPYVAFQEDHFAAPLDKTPTISELGFDHIEAPMWRGFVVPKGISDEAYTYYCDIFTQLIESDEWMADYVEYYASSPLFLIGEEADTYMIAAEDEYSASLS